jgi:hypothetical protein
VGDHSVFLPTQDAIISVRIDIAADHTAFLPTMTAAVTVGETPGVLLDPSVFSPDVALRGSAGPDATLPAKSLINVTLAGSAPSQ